MDILAIETSCDETAAAVVRDGRKILSSVIHTQVEEHGLYGGVVPEIASRRHIESITQVVQAALEKALHTMDTIDAVAVTAAPGLIGALLVGVNFAKGLAYAAGKPLIPVHHLRGHLAANYLAHPGLKPPYLGLVVSGGHSQLMEVTDYTVFRVAAATHDDAAGECFDKAARAMGLPYPGGVSVDREGRSGDPSVYPLPTPRVADHPDDFSFSGLKTAVVNLIHKARQKGEEIPVPDLAASLTHKVADILTGTTMNVAQKLGYDVISVAGGVSANSVLRARLERACRDRGYRLYLPPLDLCGDNAAMIGAQAFYQYQKGYTASLSLNGRATMEIEAEFDSPDPDGVFV